MRGRCLRKELGEIRPVKDYERYCVSKQGYVFSKGNNEELKEISPTKNNNGYLKVSLYKNGKRKMFYVHRLVAMSFLDNPNAFPMVNHKDFNKENNEAGNLEYCTARYNMAYSSMAGRHSSSYLGVTWDKRRRKWKAQYQIGKKKVFLGRFSAQEEAHEAYINAIKEI